MAQKWGHDKYDNAMQDAPSPQYRRGQDSLDDTREGSPTYSRGRGRARPTGDKPQAQSRPGNDEQIKEKHRSRTKRPEVQVYVPRAKRLQQQIPPEGSRLDPPFNNADVSEVNMTSQSPLMQDLSRVERSPSDVDIDSPKRPAKKFRKVKEQEIYVPRHRRLQQEEAPPQQDAQTGIKPNEDDAIPATKEKKHKKHKKHKHRSRSKDSSHNSGNHRSHSKDSPDREGRYPDDFEKDNNVGKEKHRPKHKHLHDAGDSLDVEKHKRHKHKKHKKHSEDKESSELGPHIVKNIGSGDEINAESTVHSVVLGIAPKNAEQGIAHVVSTAPNVGSIITPENAKEESANAESTSASVGSVITPEIAKESANAESTAPSEGSKIPQAENDEEESGEQFMDAISYTEDQQHDEDQAAGQDSHNEINDSSVGAMQVDTNLTQPSQVVEGHQIEISNNSVHQNSSESEVSMSTESHTLKYSEEKNETNVLQDEALPSHDEMIEENCMDTDSEKQYIFVHSDTPSVTEVHAGHETSVSSASSIDVPSQERQHSENNTSGSDNQEHIGNDNDIPVIPFNDSACATLLDHKHSLEHNLTEGSLASANINQDFITTSKSTNDPPDHEDNTCSYITGAESGNSDSSAEHNLCNTKDSLEVKLEDIVEPEKKTEEANISDTVHQKPVEENLNDREKGLAEEDENETAGGMDERMDLSDMDQEKIQDSSEIGNIVQVKTESDNNLELLQETNEERTVKQQHVLEEDIKSSTLATKIQDVQTNVDTLAKAEEREPIDDAGENAAAGDDWDTLFDDSGEALDPSLMEELTLAIGDVKVEKPQFDYYNYVPQDTELDYDLYGHLIEIYDFPSEFLTRDLLQIFKDYMTQGFDIKWVDDNHAIGIFSSIIAANTAIRLTHPLLKVRPIFEATPQTKKKKVPTATLR